MKIKHTALLLVLFFFIPAFLFSQSSKKKSGNGNRINFGPVIGFYTINKNHAINPTQKISAIIGFRREQRLGRDYKAFFLFGVDYFLHGLNFRSYYFAPDTLKLYDKSFGYNYSLFIQELNLPLQLKYLFKREDNSLFALLDRVPRQAVWKEIRPDAEFAVGPLRFRPFSLAGGFPAFVHPDRKAELDASEAVLGLLIDSPSGGSVAYLPGAPKVEEEWREFLDECDVLLFDGTFWTEDELCRVRGGGKGASEMGHLPLSGPCGSLAALRDIKCPRKIFFHINNTNPILDESSQAYAEVRDAGWEVARDGMEIRI